MKRPDVQTLDVFLSIRVPAWLVRRIDRVARATKRRRSETARTLICEALAARGRGAR